MRVETFQPHATMPFPATFPPDCPLAGAVDCDLTVYLVAKAVPLPASACKTQAEKGGAPNATGDAVCMRHGLSVFPSMSECNHTREILPHLGRLIAKAILTPNHGKIRATGTRTPGHMTWWPYENIARHTLFELVTEA